MAKALTVDPIIESGIPFAGHQIRTPTEAASLARATPCSACGAPMIWTFTASGARQPFDAKPESKGVLYQDADGVVRSAVVQVFTPHHATCPKWRDRKS